MRLSVACNFDDELLDGLKGIPSLRSLRKGVQGLSGRRSSVVLSAPGRPAESRTDRAQSTRRESSLTICSMRCAWETRSTPATDSVHSARRSTGSAEIKVDSVTVGQIYLLQMIKRCYPQFKVRISAHRFTDSVRKARFWEDHGADCIVLNETAFAREFAALRAIREAVRCDLSLIVNNSCRQDCAIAGTHAASLSHGSQHQKGRKRRFRSTITCCSV